MFFFGSVPIMSSFAGSLAHLAGFDRDAEIIKNPCFLLWLMLVLGRLCRWLIVNRRIIKSSDGWNTDSNESGGRNIEESGFRLTLFTGGPPPGTVARKQLPRLVAHVKKQ